MQMPKLQMHAVFKLVIRFKTSPKLQMQMQMKMPKLQMQEVWLVNAGSLPVWLVI